MPRLPLSTSDLSNNSIGSPGVRSIADAVEHNHRLISLSIDGNGAETRYLYQIGNFAIQRIILRLLVCVLMNNGAGRILRRNKTLHVEHVNRDTFETQDQFWTKRPGTWDDLVRAFDADPLRLLGGQKYPRFSTSLEEKDKFFGYRGRYYRAQDMTTTSEQANIGEMDSKGCEPELRNVPSRVQQQSFEDDCRGFNKEDLRFPKSSAPETQKGFVAQHSKLSLTHETKRSDEKSTSVPCHPELIFEPSCASLSKERLGSDSGSKKTNRPPAENQQIEKIGLFFDDFLKRAGVLSSSLDHVNTYLQKAMYSTESVNVRKS